MGNKMFNLLHKHHVAIAILLLCIFSAQVLYSIFSYSSTYDESYHLNFAVDYLKRGSFEKSAGHPVLRVVNAVPLLWFNITSTAPGSYDYGNSYMLYLRIARLVTLLYGVLLGIFVFLFAKELFGISAGLLALFLFSFEPNIIAHSSLMATDLPYTCFMFSSIYFLFKFLRRATTKNVVASGVFFGITLVSKFTSILLFPISLLLVIIHSKKRLKYFGLFLVVLIISIFVVNALYLFKGTFEKYDFRSEKLSKFSKSFPNISWPLPKQYLIDLDGQMIHAEVGHGIPAYLFGKFSDTGWWYYFLAAFIIKTPIPLLLLLLLSFFLAIKERTKNLTFLLVPVLILFIAVSFFNHINIGLRYFLPAYPFLIVMASSSVKIFYSKNAKIFLSLLLAWYVLSAIFIAPNQLAYFNEFIGGPINGYKYLLDSNVDWWQNELFLQRYLEKSKATITVNPGCEYVSGKVAVTANTLGGLWGPADRACYEWLRNLNLTPMDNIKYGYLIFDVPPKNNSKLSV